MTITLSENLSQTSSISNIGTLESKSESKPSADGQSFGQFMSEMFQLQAETASATDQDKAALAELQGQEIAAPLTLAEQAAALDTQTWSLKAVTLGPHLSVITPETSPPDTQSLEAFARSQGLDETAVNWLFGGQAGAMPAALPPTGGANALTTGSAIGALGGVIATQSTPAASLLSDTAQTAQGAASTVPTAPTSPTAPTATTLTSSALQGSVAMPANGSGSAAAGQANGTTNGQNTGQNTGAATGLLGSGLTAVQALWSMADAPDKSNKPGVNASTEDALPIQMLRMPPPAAVWMQRSLMSNVSQSAVSAQKEADISLSELDLGADWGGETLAQLLGTEGNSSSASSTGTHGSGYANFASRWDAQASNRSDLSNANGPAPDLPDANARSENIQNLADKMGQAVGQRILSEMEKGQWHLKLQLRPATLGHIEVEMRMRSGEFDAIFTAPNGTTRDLLQDGMSKLRETLSQMGMDVANIHVGGGQTGQSGGDSTPGFSRSQPAQVQASTPEITTETARAPRVKDPNDGLDVLV